jgi:all-trans-retinol dehydrogenase (NAD+)
MVTRKSRIVVRNSIDVIILHLITFSVDVTDREKVLEAGSKVLSEVGDVTILINNAGIMPQRLMLSHSADVIRKMYEINVLAHHWMFEAFLPKMLEKNHGHIVALSSIAGIIGFENIVKYSNFCYLI